MTTPLHDAAKKVDNVLVEDLITRRGADVNARDSQGKTPLMALLSWPYDPENYRPYATEKLMPIVKLLVEHCADINARDSSGRTALFLFTVFGYTQIIKYLIEQGADVNAAAYPNAATYRYIGQGGDVSNVSPLFEAIESFAVIPMHYDLDLVRELLKAPEIDLNIKSRYKSFYYEILELTPLELARRHYYFQQAEIVRMLEKVQQVQAEIRQQARQQAWQQARRQLYEKAIALAGAQLPRAGAESPAKTLSPADIQRIYQLLEESALYRKIYKELITPYLQ